MLMNENKLVNENNLIWVDCEMTGLDSNTDRLIEIATVVTDSELNILAQGPILAIYQTDETLSLMDNWNQKTHGGSGLIDRVKQSHISEKEAESLTLAFLALYLPAGKSPMCGNSICQDRRFLARHMPTLEKFFHYRHIDVSTIKELVKRWKPDIMAGIKKDSKHLAIDDILDSINELRYYRDNFVKL